MRFVAAFFTFLPINKCLSFKAPFDASPLFKRNEKTLDSMHIVDLKFNECEFFFILRSFGENYLRFSAKFLRYKIFEYRVLNLVFIRLSKIIVFSWIFLVIVGVLNSIFFEFLKINFIGFLEIIGFFFKDYENYNVF